MTSLAAYAAFLTARWDEAEKAASNPAHAPEETDDGGPEEVDAYFEWDALRARQPHEAKCAWRVGEGLDDECSCGYPRKVLADLAAKRAILDDAVESARWATNPDCPPESAPFYRDRAGHLGDALHHLAAPFRDHPDHPANQEGS